MASIEKNVHPLLHHYARSGYARHLQNIVMEVIKKSKSRDPSLLFWRAYGQLMEGSYRDSLNELSTLRASPDAGLAACEAMISAYEQMDRRDDDAIFDLRDSISQLEGPSSDASRLLHGRLLALLGQGERARSQVELVLSSGTSVEARCALGWVLLSQAEGGEDAALTGEDPVEEALVSFNEALSGDPLSLDALLGKARCLEMGGRGGEALQLLTDLCGRHPWFTPALEARARLYAALSDWESCCDACQTIMNAEPRNITALTLLAQHALTQDGSLPLTQGYLRDLADAVDREEPSNAHLAYQISLLFSRLAWRTKEVLTVAAGLADRAKKGNKGRPEYAALYADLAQAVGRTGDARSALDEAMMQDAAHLDLILSDTRLKLAEGNLDDARSQLELLRDLAATLGGGPKVKYTEALVLMSDRMSMEETEAILEGALSDILAALEGDGSRAPTAEALIKADPSLILSIIDLINVHVGGDARQSTEPPSPSLPRCLRALDQLSRHMPGHPGLGMAAAQVAFLNGDVQSAQRKVQDILSRAPSLPEAHFLMARICLAQDKPEAAIQGLEQALAQDLGLREAPQFLTLTARALLAMDKVRDAVTVAEQSLRSRGVRPPQPGSPPRYGPLDLSIHDRCAAYLVAIQAHERAGGGGGGQSARMRLAEAKTEFEGTPAEISVLIAEAMLRVGQGAAESAIDLLRGVPPTSPHYIKARVALAAIHLKHRNDPRAYEEVYQEALSHRQDVHSFLMVGEAYMQIQEPEKAVEAMEQALKRNPRDLTITRRICGYLVSAHEYLRAIDKYRAGIRNNPGDVDLPSELAQLYVRLGMHEDAKKALELIRRNKKGDTIEGGMVEVRALRMMAKSARAAAAADGTVDSYLGAVSEAVAAQAALLARMRQESHPDLLREQKEASACVHLDAAVLLHDLGRSDEALGHLRQGMKIAEGSERLQVYMARVLLETGQLDAAAASLQEVLRAAPGHAEASLLLGEVFFFQGAEEQAIFQFTSRLQAVKAPEYGALARCIQLLRRAGRLAEAQRFVSAAERADPRAAASAGLRFCKGLHYRYLQKPSEALRELNASRRDSVWANDSLYHMAEIYLNTDNLGAWAQVSDEDGDAPPDGPRDIPDLSDGPGGAGGAASLDDQTRSAVGAARKLLGMVRLKPGESPTRVKVLQCYALMGLQERAEIEQAMRVLLDLASRDRDHVPVLLALATAFLLLGQGAKARNQLKRISKLPYRPAHADEYERAWLLLADIYMRAGKYDLAQELCTKCLKYNKSCARAWEYSGQMLERESAYKDAAEHYERAWGLDLESSPQVGYRLAFNYLKAKRAVDAIDVCHKVLAAYPDFPGIRREVLDRAREGLRP